ncbi:MAG: hypothetical protein HY718_14855 [Planctomycetes bacterium]|nr:hypothetical protein [Planctomycetota bacterium]
MSQWHQQFAEQMESLFAQSSTGFERFADEVIEPVFESVSAFLARWHYEASCPPSETPRRVYRFGLTEDGYLLIWFRLSGLDTVECEYEYSLPHVGRVNGVRTTGSLRAAESEWVESCFQMALNNFVSKFIDAGQRRHAEQPALV